MIVHAEDKMSATKTIIISAPKFITSEPTFELALDSQFHTETGKTRNMKRPAFQCVSTMERIQCTDIESSAPPRKRRLDHLSLEEKIQRKKLKNRIAAQSSRDRKKAKMDELEFEVKELKDKVSSLTSCCERLRDEVARLSEENSALRSQMSAQQLETQTPSVGCAPAVTGPAASRHGPLPQGRGAQPARGLAQLLATLLALALQATPRSSCPTTSSRTTWTATSSCRSSSNWPAASSRRRNSTTPLPLATRFPQLHRFLGEAEMTAMLKWWSRHRKKWSPVEIT